MSQETKLVRGGAVMEATGPRRRQSGAGGGGRRGKAEGDHYDRVGITTQSQRVTRDK